MAQYHKLTNKIMIIFTQTRGVTNQRTHHVPRTRFDYVLSPGKKTENDLCPVQRIIRRVWKCTGNRDVNCLIDQKMISFWGNCVCAKRCRFVLGDCNIGSCIIISITSLQIAASSMCRDRGESTETKVHGVAAYWCTLYSSSLWFVCTYSLGEKVMDSYVVLIQTWRLSPK